MRNLNSTNYHEFVNIELKKKGFCIKSVTKEYMDSRLNDIMAFVNGILNEYKDAYELWKPKPKEWFLNPLNRKFDFSLVIEDFDGEIALLAFNSINNKLHIHFTYVKKKYRSMGLSKLHTIKLSQIGIDRGFQSYEGKADKQNTGSIILLLKMDYKIESMEDNGLISFIGDLKETLEKTYKEYCKTNN